MTLREIPVAMKLMRSFEATHSQLAAMVILSEGQSTMRGIAEGLGVSGEGASQLVDYLERKGYAKRTHGTEDRRHVLVAITPSGRTIMEKLSVELKKTFS